MRDAAHEFFMRSPYLAGPVFALVLFVIVFALVVARAWSAKKSELDEAARLPLAEDSRKVPHE